MRFSILFGVACWAMGSAAYSFGSPGRNATYDYVVVGGGTAGLVMATRLASHPGTTVAVIEAGGFYEADDGNISTTPAYDVFWAGIDANDTNPLVDWGFVTEPQAGANNRQLHYARGKTMGGSSARHFMFYHRPTTGALQKWADEVADRSYSFDNFINYFKKSANYTPPQITYQNSSNVQAPNAFSPTGGPLRVSFGKYEVPFATWVQKAFQAVGQAAIAGFQVGNLIGSAYMAFTENPDNGFRSSSESSYLQDTNAQTPGLKVYNNTLALKILFKGNDKTANGVTVVPETTSGPKGDVYTLHATKEVIVSAGTFQSPQLLMVSGVGPAEQLKEHNIPVVHHLPGVGQNMWDHAFFGTTFRVDIQTSSAGQNNATLNAEAIEAFVDHAAGPLTISADNVVGWEKLPNPLRSGLSKSTQKALNTFPSDWPELEFLPINDFLGNGGNLVTADPLDGYNYATVATALVAPLSRGNITLTNGDMATPPRIDPNWITDPADAELAVAGFKRQRQVWQQMANITIGQEYYPGPSVQTDDEILKFIRDNMVMVWHAASTCKMGTKHDNLAVVDTKARVYGTNRLRVVDASAFPFLIPGHPQATIYALAEKIADDIISAGCQ